MKNSLRSGNSFFDWFRITDEIYEKNNIHCILSILAEGIEKYPKWVKYINERKHRYKIEMHGWDHSYVHSMSCLEGYTVLYEAKKKIENAFNINVTHWYVPNGRLYFPEWGPKVCEKLGIQFNSKGDVKDYYQLYLHYWNTRDQKRLQKYINDPDIFILPVKQETDLTKPYVTN